MQIAQKQKITIESDGQGNLRFVYVELYAADDANPTLAQSICYYSQPGDLSLQSLLIEFNKTFATIKQTNGVS